MTGPDAAGFFRGRIYRVGILRCVDVPHEVGAEFADWRHPPVRFRIGTQSGRSHLAPAGGGAYRLYLDGALRKKLGVDAGDEVEVEIHLDPSLQAEPFPEEVHELAAGIPGGETVLATLPPGLKRQILAFLAGAASGATRDKRLCRIEEILRERAEKQGFADEESR